MMLNLRIEGLVEEVINELVRTGIASSKSEAIRLTILHYNEDYGIKPIREFINDELAIAKMQRIDREIEAGKKKLLTKKDILAKYPHLKDV